MNETLFSSFRKARDGAVLLPLDLRVTETRGEGEVTRTLDLGGKEVFYRVHGAVLPQPLRTWDFAVIASIFTAMRLRRPVHVHGPVSRSLLANLEEFQEAWAVWLPAQYGVVPIWAEAEIEPDRVHADKGMFAFSGGVDATYSIARHLFQEAGRRTLEPAAAALVHGFDIDLAQQGAFAVARRSAEQTLSGLGVPLSIVETNWKTNLCYDWRMEHASGLAACLFQFEGLAGTAVIGGDEGYDNVDIPWGSNPVSNPLLSSQSMVVRTEGSGCTRSDRLGLLVKLGVHLDHLRVCWENAETGSNCGICEKCIRTQVNFRAVGAEPRGFLRQAEWWRVATIPSRSLGDNYFLREALAVAKRRGVGGNWRYAVRLGIAKNTLMSPITFPIRAAKNAVRRHEPLYRYLRKVLKK